MIFGSFVGGMADWGGRRTFVVLYAILYALSCMTKRKYQTVLKWKEWACILKATFVLLFFIWIYSLKRNSMLSKMKLEINRLPILWHFDAGSIVGWCGDILAL